MGTVDFVSVISNKLDGHMLQIITRCAAHDAQTGTCWGGEGRQRGTRGTQFSSAQDGIPGPGLCQEYLTVDSVVSGLVLVVPV